MADELPVEKQPVDMNNGSRYRAHVYRAHVYYPDEAHASILSSRTYLLLHYHYLTKITHGVSHRFFFSTAGYGKKEQKSGCRAEGG